MVRAYSVSKPFLAGEADPEVDYFEAIRQFAEMHFLHLARKAIVRMQRMPPTGIFASETRRRKNMWAEWRWYYEKYAFLDGPLNFAFEDFMSKVIDGVVHDVEDEVAILLCCAASEEQAEMPWRSNDLIASTIREMLSEAAGVSDTEDYDYY